MVPEEKLLRIVQDFHDVIKIPEYTPAIERIMRKGQDHHVDIFLWPKSDFSKCQTPTKGSLVYTLWIKEFPKLLDGKELAFDMLHEFGHAIDPVKLPARKPWEPKTEAYIELEREREIQAWKWSDLEFENHPELHPDREAYLRYRDWCLASYGVSPARFEATEPRF